MGDTERQLRWALICGIDVHWCALICGTDGHWHEALIITDIRHWWTLTGGTAGATLILIIGVH
ncbi:unnamed protein product [Staurois parvus]|uniref:Uncharacterized protein n=1 Tax=Staurois parvus TaxID=386267 RepID=A0ABN9D282_9NEOB|nr:unnamed protein product [Staurois parvus]